MGYPKKLFHIVDRELDHAIYGALSACAGFELGAWRQQRLVQHLLGWLPHFALREEERNNLEGDAYEQLRQSAARLFNSGVRAVKSRGELGELLLFLLCVEEYDAAPFVTRLFYKHRTNDSVTGFDCALFVEDENNDLEIWMGEAKLYKDPKKGIAEAINSVIEHIDSKVLKEEKILVSSKIETDHPMRDHLEWLFDSNTSLDDIVERLVVPVLIAGNSKAVAGYKDNESYQASLSSEFSELAMKLEAATGLKDVRVVLLYVPMNDKDELITAFVDKLEAFEDNA